MENLQGLKIGSYIKAVYGCGCKEGIVTKILKNKVVIQEYKSYYYHKTKETTRTATDILTNITTKRIYEIEN